MWWARRSVRTHVHRLAWGCAGLPLCAYAAEDLPGLLALPHWRRHVLDLLDVAQENIDADAARWASLRVEDRAQVRPHWTACMNRSFHTLAVLALVMRAVLEPSFVRLHVFAFASGLSPCVLL